MVKERFLQEMCCDVESKVKNMKLKIRYLKARIGSYEREMRYCLGLIAFKQGFRKEEIF